MGGIMAANQMTADKDEAVRKAALEGLALFAKGLVQPDANLAVTIDSIVQCFEDPIEEIRETAIISLAAVAPGNRDAINQAMRKLSHPQEYVRDAAVKGIQGVTPRNDKKTIQKLLTMSTSNTGANIRSSVEKALAAISSEGERNAIAAAAAFFAEQGEIPDPDDLSED